jgi:hypothetical protein
MAVFNEYLNWSLISLYLVDHADPENLDAMIENVEMIMVNRGFPQFKPFNQQFLKLYRERGPGRTVADLYPDLIRWSAEHQTTEKAAGARPAS